MTSPGSALILGARNLGGAIVSHLVERRWSVAAVARTDQTLAAIEARGAASIRADAADPSDLAAALTRAREVTGGLDLIVNAVRSERGIGRGPFGGGPIADAGIEAFRDWAQPVAEQCFVFLSEGARALRQSGGGTLIQVGGGSALRAIPGRGSWAAGSFAARALVQAAAQELREEGIHVALLAVDATIDTSDSTALEGQRQPEELADMEEISRAVSYLAEQTSRGLSHELQLTPSGERWVP